MQKETYLKITVFLLVVLLIPRLKNNYNAQVYSSFEEEQFDNIRADMNYLSDKIDKIYDKLNID